MDARDLNLVFIQMYHELTASAMLSLLCGLISRHSCRPGAPAVPGYFNFVHIDVLLACISVYYMHVWYPWKPEKSVGFPGSGVRGVGSCLV